MTRTAKVISLYPADDANATVRHLREKSVYDPMLPNDITEELIEASRQRAREMVFAVVVFGFAIIGAAWALGYLVGMVWR